MKTVKSILIIVISLLVLGKTAVSQGVKEVVKGNNEFTFDIYDQINDKEENLFFSPYSVSSALAMTYNGAEGKTKNEMSDVLNFNKDINALSENYSALNDHITGLSSKKIQLNIANAIWGQQDYGFRKAFLELNKKYYGAGIKQVNFKKEHKEIRNQINKWVEDKTNQKIKNLIKPNVLDRMTRMVLVNAIYFNGKWENPFKKEDNFKDKFYIYSKCETQTEFMFQKLSLKYHEDDIAQVVEIPYSEKSLSMMVILPKEKYGMEQLEKYLDNELYENYNKSLSTYKVELSFPKFEVEDDYELNSPLKDMGMKSAFGEGADFSGMTGSKDLFIDNVVHKTYVKVDEEGTEAAAATGIVMRKTSAIMETKEFKADHPFIFIIKENKNDTILFMGRIMNPEE
jgi:serpin B